MESFDITPGELASEGDTQIPQDATTSDIPEPAMDGEAEEPAVAETSEEALSSVPENKAVVSTSSSAAKKSSNSRKSTGLVTLRPKDEDVAVKSVDEPDDAPLFEDDEPIQEETDSGSRGFHWPTRSQLIAWAPYWAVILLAAILRFWDLGAKPLHHDESLHAYFSLGLLHNLQNWGWCIGLNNPPAGYTCYQYDPLLHGPFQFHAIALVYQLSQWFGAPDNGVNTTTVRIMAALLGTVLVGLPYFIRDYIGKVGAWIACFLMAVSPSLVYFSRFAREDIYLACFTLLMVVAVGRYVRERKIRWIIIAAVGFALAYATAEATFLTIAVFGSFMIGLAVWEIGTKWRLREHVKDPDVASFLPRTFAPVTLLAYALIGGILAKVALGIMGQLSDYIIHNTFISDQRLKDLESTTLKVIPWLGILLGLLVFSILALEVYDKWPTGGRRGLARFVDRKRQPLLDTILTMPWTHWFFPLIIGWFIFIFLFSVVFTNLGGIADGIWKGLYYWMEQQNVARGGQPWYYYLLVIPLYEQVGVVFGIVGIVRCLMRPNPFRMFMVYWFLGDFFLFSWAGEKMPWLTVFMTMPMMILAAIALEPAVLACYAFVRNRFFTRASATEEREETPSVPVRPSWAPAYVSPTRAALGFFGVLVAILCLIPTIHNMYELTYIHPADGPHEMMVYVQTTTDVNTVMAKIEEIDQKNYGGKHNLQIGVMAGPTWPFAWYLRDYTQVCYSFPDGCPTWKNTAAVVLAGLEDNTGDISAGGLYLSKQYKMRSWWDEGYKLPACPQGVKPSLSCTDPTLGSGVGPGLWLSYGDQPPKNASFNLGLTIQRVWNWWWNRTSFGDTGGSYDMLFFVKKGLNVNP